MKASTFVFVIAFSVPLAAQAPVQPPVPPSVPVAPAIIPVGSRVGELPTSYNDGGRRDPFASLVAPKRSSIAPNNVRPRGLAGVALADVTVRGIVRSGQTMIAILEAPNRQSFTTRAKDKLLDATVVSVDQQGVTFSEEVGAGAPPSQVRKLLRPAGDEFR